MYWGCVLGVVCLVLSVLLIVLKLKLKTENRLDTAPVCYDIAHLIINLNNLTNKKVYESIMYRKSIPTAENKWVELPGFRKDRLVHYL